MSIKEFNQKRKTDIIEQAEAGSLQAVASLTGVSRQTLYRWRKDGMSISKAAVLQRISNPNRGMNGEKARGRKLGDRDVTHLRGFKRKDKLQARKSVLVAVCDLREALKVRLASEGISNAGDAHYYWQRPFLSKREELELAVVLRGINLLIPKDHWLPHKQFEFFLPIPTKRKPKRTNKTTLTRLA
jgi:transcriptional regulator with XRE-family HTH domain